MSKQTSNYKRKQQENKTYSVTFSPLPPELTQEKLEILFSTELGTVLFNLRLEEQQNFFQLDFQSEALQKQAADMDLEFKNIRIKSSILSLPEPGKNKSVVLNIPICTSKLQSWAYAYWEKFIPNFKPPKFLFIGENGSVTVPLEFKQQIASFRLAYKIFTHKHCNEIVNQFSQQNSTTYVTDSHKSSVIIIGLHSELLSVLKMEMMKYPNANPPQISPSFRFPFKRPNVSFPDVFISSRHPRTDQKPSYQPKPIYIQDKKNSTKNKLEALVLTDHRPSWKYSSSENIDVLDLANEKVGNKRVTPPGKSFQRKANTKPPPPPAEQKRKKSNSTNKYECESLPPSAPYPNIPSYSNIPPSSNSTPSYSSNTSISTYSNPSLSSYSNGPSSTYPTPPAYGNHSSFAIPGPVNNFTNTSFNAPAFNNSSFPCASSNYLPASSNYGSVAPTYVTPPSSYANSNYPVASSAFTSPPVSTFNSTTSPSNFAAPNSAYPLQQSPLPIHPSNYQENLPLQNQAYPQQQSYPVPPNWHPR